MNEAMEIIRNETLSLNLTQVGIFSGLENLDELMLEEKPNAEINFSDHLRPVNRFVKDIKKFKSLSGEESTTLATRYEEIMLALKMHKVAKQMRISKKISLNESSVEKVSEIIRYKGLKKKEGSSLEENSAELINAINKRIDWLKKRGRKIIPVNFLVDKFGNSVKLTSARKEAFETRNKIIVGCQGLVFSVARRYKNLGLGFDDLVSEGNIGLFFAVEKFNSSMGNKFSTYAIYWIKQSISRALSNKSRAIRIPVHIREMMSKVYRVNKLSEGGKASVVEIAQRTGISEEKVRKCQEYSYKMQSIDQPLYVDSEESFGNFLEDNKNPSVEEEILKRNINSRVQERLKIKVKTVEINKKGKAVEKISGGVLTPREHEVITRRFGIGRLREETLEEIGDDKGLTRERIRQIEAKAIRKLKGHILLNDKSLVAQY